MRRSAGALLIAALLCAPRAQAQDAIPEEAKLYFRNGVELIQGQPPNYQDAYYQFKLAWEKSKSWKVLSNWGLCALKLERDGEAIWAYTEYLKQKDVDPEERKELERDLLLLNGNAASVTLSSDIPDLEVVDARAGSSVPPQSYRLEAGTLVLRLRAGSHTLTASSQGKSLRWDVTLSPGRTDEHRFEFAASAAPAPAAVAPAPAAVVPAVPAAATPAAPVAASPATTPREKSGGALRTVGYVVAGVGVLTLGGGVFMGLRANQQEEDARGKCATLPHSGFSCPESSRGDFKTAGNTASAANVLYVAGGAVAAGGLVMILVGGPKVRERSSASLAISPTFGAHGGGLFAHGAF